MWVRTERCAIYVTMRRTGNCMAIRLMPPIVCLCLALFSGAGCASVTIVDGDGAAQVSYRPFAIFIDAEPETAPQYVAIKTLGVTRTSTGLSIGLTRAEIAALPAEGCAAVVVVKSDLDAKAAADLAKAVGPACVIQ